MKMPEPCHLPPAHSQIFTGVKTHLPALKKNAYALKTPHVVALPFIYGVECIQFHTLWATLKNVF